MPSPSSNWKSKSSRNASCACLLVDPEDGAVRTSEMPVDFYCTTRCHISDVPLLFITTEWCISIILFELWYHVIVSPLFNESIFVLRKNTIVPTVSESEGLILFLSWLRSLQDGYDGVILVSHGAIFLDIPVLIRALQRTSMTQIFFQVSYLIGRARNIWLADKRCHLPQQ